MHCAFCNKTQLKSCQVVNSAVAVANGDKMYCFGDYSCPDLNMNGSMDVQIIQTGINKYKSLFKIGWYNEKDFITIQIIMNGVFWNIQTLPVRFPAGDVVTLLYCIMTWYVANLIKLSMWNHLLTEFPWHRCIHLGR